MARDRKRAKQRRIRGGGASARQRPASDGAATPGRDHPSGSLERADVPGSLDHASAEVDEFDAALIAGAGGVPADADADAGAEPQEQSAPADGDGVDLDHLSEREIEAEALSEGDLAEDELQEPAGTVSRRRPGGGGEDGGVSPEQASGAPVRSGNRAIGFLRASWAELHRVQWPDRRHVFQATAVVLGFVAIAGAYLGLADYVAKEIVEFIL